MLYPRITNALPRVKNVIIMRCAVESWVDQSTREVPMTRREFLKTAGMTVGSVPFWMGLLPESLWGKIPSRVKISGLKTFVVHVGDVNWVFVKIYTNEGVVGLGEGS